MCKCVTQYVVMPLCVSQSAELCRLLAFERPFEDCPLMCNQELPTSPVKFPKHNFHSFLLPLSYGNSMWNPNSVFSEMHAHYPALSCASNLLHFCCAAHNGTLFALSILHLCIRNSVEKKWEFAWARVSSVTGHVHWGCTWIHSKWDETQCVCACRCRAHLSTRKTHYTSRVGQRWVSVFASFVSRGTSLLPLTCLTWSIPLRLVTPLDGRRPPCL